MNIKSLLLGSAAALVAASGAYAADAVEVIAEPEAMDYVRICDTYGTGYYYIPGTETCLRVGGYLRYDIGGGDLFGADTTGFVETSRSPVLDPAGNPVRDPQTGEIITRGTFEPDGEDDTYDKRARLQLQMDARSETELGTLRAFAAINFDYDINSAAGSFDDDSDNPSPNAFFGASDSSNVSVNHAYIELGGFRVGKTDSMFSTFTGYAGGVIHDDLGVPFGPFDTHQIAYTFTGTNGFSAAVALEQGSGSDILTDYIPHVVVGASYTQGWGGISAVAGYDANNEEFAGKVRLDVKATETISMFVMGGYKTDDFDDNDDNDGDGSNYYGNWAGDNDDDENGDGFAVWGGVSAGLTEKAKANVQVAYDEGENFAASANIEYELVPGLKITPEVSYADNFDEDFGGDDDDDGDFGGFVRFQRSF